MNKKGFTLIELLAVIALLAILIVIAVPIISGIGNGIRGNMLDEKKDFVEEAATLYGEDTKGSVINSEAKYQSYPCVSLKVKRLVEEKYLDPDKDQYCTQTSNGEECQNCTDVDKCISDPNDSKNYLDNYDVIIYYRNNRIHALMDLEQKATCS